MRRTLGLIVVVAAAAAAWPLQVAARSNPPAVGQGGDQKPAQAATGARAAAEKTLLANERAVNDAVAKGDAARFRSMVAEDSWAIDPMSGRMSTAEFLKGFDQMTKDMKMTSWDISDSKVFWIDQNAAVHTYKWTGQGTYQGQPIPSPVWASTVWARRAGKWQAIFHQESTVGPPAK
jgi:hypothetical protein